jgi:hypothetical protein
VFRGPPAESLKAPAAAFFPGRGLVPRPDSTPRNARVCSAGVGLVSGLGIGKYNTEKDYVERDETRCRDTKGHGVCRGRNETGGRWL